ncbi:MAG: alpha/beta hydrolase [Sphingobacteriales bacterium]|nr:alpha/beta hydrolase [Sphingobacteriales bacterium]
MKLNPAKNTGLRFTDEGQGEPIILLYGLFGSVKNFNPLIRHLRETHRVIVPIFPFYEMGFCVDIFTLTRFLQEVTEELKLDRFHLLGNSMGGHIALLYTLNHPGKVRSLTLSGSSGLYEHGMGDTYPRRRDYDYIKTKTELTFYNPEVATKELVDEIYATVNSRKAIQIVSLAKSTIRHNVEKELSRINIPCCLIWGKQDTITPPEVAESFHRLLPKAELYWIDECGHVPMLERPEQFNPLLDEFLSKADLVTG